ncbi:hypothetical protein [Glycomyces sp. MUSA5-2]|uniref:hypothetical protein n=1 Tax=Glycomyces sp. MUSA5-2 TaxID=2053002 RepID=UPI003009A8C9
MSPSTSEPQSRWLRDARRRDLGVEPHQQLIVLASGADERSLLSLHPTLPERLLADLPMDDYRVAVAPDPGLLPGGHHSLEMWMWTAIGNGLLVARPGEDWEATARAVIAAADAVIGDGGALTRYAASLGIPTAQATAAWIDTPTGEQRRPEFIVDGDRLLARVRSLCATQTRPGDLAPAVPDTVQELDDLALAPQYRPTLSWRCEIQFGRGVVSWRRFPAQEIPWPDRSGHFVADARCLSVRARDRADLLIHHHDPLPEAEAREEAQIQLRYSPIAQAMAVRTSNDEMLLSTRAGQNLRLRCRPELFAAAASVWLAAGQPEIGVWELVRSSGGGPLSVQAWD